MQGHPSWGLLSANVKPPGHGADGGVECTTSQAHSDRIRETAHQEFSLGVTGHGMVHNARTGPAYDGTGCMGLDVQVKVEKSVIADYLPRVLRKQRLLWVRTQHDTTNGEISYVDEWELSSAGEEGIAC